MADILENPVDLADDAYEQEIQVEQEPIEVVAYRSYNQLDDKPQINGVELVGNKTSSDLGITAQINSAVNSEAQTRQQADGTLQGKIDAEETARKAADKDIQDVLDGETLARQNADTALGGRIDTEIHDRQVADIGLQGQIDAITSKSDVVDVVASYAALQAYDTSTLGNNDVVKVLDDETHGDAMTYYRWSTTTQTWSYIGQEAPYYTKSQTDTLLLDKQDKIDATHKLSADLVDDTSTTNKFVTAQDKTAWNSKQDALTAGKNIDITGTTISTPAIAPEVIAELPTTGDSTKLYLVPREYTGKNLLPPSLSRSIGYLDAQGQIYESNPRNEATYDFLKVKPNTTYTFRLVHTNDTVDADLWWGIGAYSQASASSFISMPFRGLTYSNWYVTFTTPNGANYIRISGRFLEHATAVQLEQGYEPTEYTPYEEYSTGEAYDKWLWVNNAWEQVGEPEKVEALISNEFVGNLRDIMGWKLGDINGYTGVETTSTDLIISDRIYKAKDGLYIPANPVCKVALYTYTDNGVFIKERTTFATNDKGGFIPSGTNFRIRLDYNTIPSGGRPSLTQDNLVESPTYQNFTLITYPVYRASAYDKLKEDGYQTDANNLKNSIRIVIGDINSAGIDYTSNRRLATLDVLHFDYDILLPRQNNFYVYLWTYTAQDGSGATGQGWQEQLPNQRLIIRAGTYFRLLFVINKTSTTPLYDIYDNDIFKAIEIYKLEKDQVQNPNIRSIAHQGYSTTSQTYGNSRLSSYIGAKQHGFNYGECDVQFSSDGVPVCSHDASFNSNGTTVVIAEHTWAELQTYNYYGETIASFEQVLSKCKEIGLGLYIDHLNSSWSDAQWNALFGIVMKYQMQDRVWWLQGISRAVSTRILTWYPKAQIALVVNTNDLSTAVTEANAIKTVNNEISIDFNYAQVSVSDLITYIATANAGVQFEAWMIDDTTNFINYAPYLSGITSNKICYNDVRS